MAGDGGRTDDDRLLAQAEEALTQIKVSRGLSEEHAKVLAALRIRLKGDPGASLEQLLAAADDPDRGPRLDDVIAGSDDAPSTSIDDLLAKGEKPKRSLDDLL
jgi:hypothetical protein